MSFSTILNRNDSSGSSNEVSGFVKERHLASKFNYKVQQRIDSTNILHNSFTRC